MSDGEIVMLYWTTVEKREPEGEALNSPVYLRSNPHLGHLVMRFELGLKE